MDIRKLLICIFAALTLTLSGCASMSSTWDWFFDDDDQQEAMMDEEMEMDDEDLIADDDLLEEELIADEFADDEMMDEEDEMMGEEGEMMEEEMMDDDYGDSPASFSPPFNTIYFDYKSTEVGANALNILQMHAKFLDANPEAVAVLSGHTDSVASADYNKKLALRRAEAVAEALVEMGADPEQLNVVSKGMSDPASSEDGAGSAALNRRVEISYE